MPEHPPAPSPDTRPPLIRARRALLIALVGVTLILLGTFLLRTLRAVTGPQPVAEWIWTPESLIRYTAPRAFYAVRDFRLGDSVESATLRVVADEEYVLYVNGRRVGSNRYRETAGENGTHFDLYPVGSLLRRGANRVVVELRSERGAGGLLLALDDDESGRRLLATDRSWRVFDHFHPGILEGWLGLGDGRAAASWGPAPSGRWGKVIDGPVRPVFEQAAGSWLERRPLAPERTSRLDRRAGADSTARFDWGREVYGYLVLEQQSPTGLPVGLLELSDDPPRRGEKGETDFRADASAVFLPGAARWRDTVPRRFRSVRVRGLPALSGAWVEPVGEEWAARLPTPPPAEAEGVFGLEPPPLRSPVEHEVRRQLQSVPRVSGG